MGGMGGIGGGIGGGFNPFGGGGGGQGLLVCFVACLLVRALALLLETVLELSFPLSSCATALCLLARPLLLFLIRHPLPCRAGFDGSGMFGGSGGFGGIGSGESSPCANECCSLLCAALVLFACVGGPGVMSFGMNQGGGGNQGNNNNQGNLGECFKNSLSMLPRAHSELQILC